MRKKVEAFGREMARHDRAFDRVLWVAGPGVLPSVRAALGNQPNQVLRTLATFREEIERPSAIEQDLQDSKESQDSTRSFNDSSNDRGSETGNSGLTTQAVPYRSVSPAEAIGGIE